jgi:acetyl-CoA carboxylase biotin carboxyl carrier protein
MSGNSPGKLDADELGRLLRAIEESKLVDVEIDYGGLHIRVRKDGAPGGEAPVSRVPQAASQDKVAATPSASARRVEVKAPMLGVFYRCPEPGAPPFVEVGKAVAAQDTVALIEVMKLFNQVQAGAEGRVVEILVEDGALVEHGQALLVIEVAE